MNHKSAEVIKANLRSALDERERALSQIDFDIEMKEQAIQRARSAGAKTRAANELVALKVERVRRVQLCCEIAQAIAEFDAMVDL